MSEHHPHNIDELKHEVEEHDEWFRHPPGEEHQSAHGDFNPYVVMGFLAVTIVIVFAVAFVVVPWFARMVQGQRIAVREQGARVVEEYVNARANWQGDLTGEPTWVNEGEGVVRVPIDFAIDQVVERYAEQER